MTFNEKVNELCEELLNFLELDDAYDERVGNFWVQLVHGVTDSNVIVPYIRLPIRGVVKKLDIPWDEDFDRIVDKVYQRFYDSPHIQPEYVKYGFALRIWIRKEDLEKNP